MNLIKKYKWLPAIAFILMVCGLTILPRESRATTWQVLKNATFNRADTTTGAAGNQTAVGENWIDTLGGIWSIKSGLVSGVGSATPGNTLLRPKSEAQTEQRVVIDRVQSAATETVGIVLRVQADTSRYYVFQGGTTLRINRVSSTNVVSQLTNVVLPAQPLKGDVVSLDFSVTGGAGTASLSATFIDTNAGINTTLTATDASGSKITTAGQCGIDIGSASTLAFTDVIVYYDNTSSATSTPLSMQSGTSATLVLVGTGTSWTNATTFALTTSASNGAALGSVTWTDATHISVSITNSGSVGDSLLIKDNTSGTLSIVSVTAPIITVSPLQILSNSTGNTMTVYGNVQTWLSSTPVFTVTGVAGVSITSTVVVNDTTATITVSASTTTGTVTLSDTNVNYPASTTFAVNYAIKLNDSNIVMSPYVWDVNGSLYAETNYAGSYVHLKFTTTATGPIIILYDPAPNIAGSLSASNYPTIGWSLNPTAIGGKWTYQQLTSNTGSVQVSASVVAGTYELLIYVKSIRGSPTGSDGGRWIPSCRGVRLLGVQVDPSATTVAYTRRTKNAVFFGDSITQGAGTLGVSSAINDDAWPTWVRVCADALKAEWGQVGIAGQIWGANTTATPPLPALYLASNTPPDTISYYQSGRSRLSAGKLSPMPDYVFVAEGTNDITQNITSSVQSTITLLRSITNSTTPIVLVMPFGGFESSGTTGIPAGFNNYKTAVPSDKYVFLVDPTGIYPTTGLNNGTSFTENMYTFDGLHPKYHISMALGGYIATNLQSQIDSLSTSTSTRTHY